MLLVQTPEFDLISDFCSPLHCITQTEREFFFASKYLQIPFSCSGNGFPFLPPQFYMLA